MYRHSLHMVSVDGTRVDYAFAVSHGRNPLRLRDASVTVYRNGREVEYCEGTWENVKEWAHITMLGFSWHTN